jgi:hypothetical protein
MKYLIKPLRWTISLALLLTWLSWQPVFPASAQVFPALPAGQPGPGFCRLDVGYTSLYSGSLVSESDKHDAGVVRHYGLAELTGDIFASLANYRHTFPSDAGFASRYSPPGFTPASGC